MIVGIGIDIVEIARMEKSLKKFGKRLLNKFLTEKEIELIKRPEYRYAASRFAAKEAAVKALGTGFGAGISARQIEILPGLNGVPVLKFFGAARLRLESIGGKRAHLSISHERNYAVALAILED